MGWGSEAQWSLIDTIRIAGAYVGSWLGTSSTSSGGTVCNLTVGRITKVKLKKRAQSFGLLDLQEIHGCLEANPSQPPHAIHNLVLTSTSSSVLNLFYFHFLFDHPHYHYYYHHQSLTLVISRLTVNRDGDSSCLMSPFIL